MKNARAAYRESNVHGASAIRLVILLYDQMIQDLAQAQDAISAGDIEKRTQLLNHAILVIAHLQSPLDFSNGGKVAGDLDHFYNILRQNLVRVQFSPSTAGIRQQITDVQALREAWIEVECAEKSATPPPSPPSHTAGSGSSASRVDWKG
ncbi:MAG TPA: flagellar export chaperone FliS [Terriglobales bacterium]|jgi:flagellar protein FliS|nr:flagellar export chaperone FliS [Terriglobales bacterium]